MANHTDAIGSTKTQSSHITFDRLIELLDSESKRIHESNDATKSTKVAVQKLRLCGGNDHEINHETTGPPALSSSTSAAPGKLPHL